MKELINKNGFETLDIKKPNYAYIIGLLQADGTNYIQSRNRGRISIELQIKDISLLYKIKTILNCKSYIKTRKRNINFALEYESCILSIYDMKIRNIFSEYIPIGKKSDIIHFPNGISEIDYWRGYIDGNGSLGFTKNGIPFISLTTMSSNLIEDFKTFIFKETNYKFSCNRNKRDNIYNIVLTKEKAQIISNLLYYDNCLCLDRKLEKSKEINKWYRPINMRKRTWNIKKWTDEEDFFIKNHNISESMESLCRTKKSIYTRLYRLKSSNYKANIQF